MDERARALADGIEAALPGWVERSVEQRLLAWRARADADDVGYDMAEVMAAARLAGAEATAEVGSRVQALLASDFDEQRANPLSLVRSAVRYPTEVLRRAGVPPVERDEFAATRFPDDVYDLTPASFADLDPALLDAGIAWGAAKAWAHKQRHGAGRGSPR